MVLKKSADEITANAAFAAAKNALDAALTDAMSSDEERAQRKAEQAALAKRKRTKRIAWLIVGILLTLGVIGMVVSYWQWFILLGLVGLAALYGRYRWRARRRARVASEGEEESLRPAPAQAASEGTRARSLALTARATPAAKATSAEDAQAIEDELAALKARVEK